MTEPQHVLEFWFGELTDGFADDAHRSRWFKPDNAFDAQIRERFAALIDDLGAGAIEAWLGTPAGCLAFVLVADQFPRNIFRGTVRAYATDRQGLDAARLAVRRGYDRALGWDERAFIYMPFTHSEDLIDQHTGVGLITELRDATPSGLRHLTGGNLRFAHEHRDIVIRFGRFPHRNAVLERPSTPEEAAFAAAGDGFGQG